MEEAHLEVALRRWAAAEAKWLKARGLIPEGWWEILDAEEKLRVDGRRRERAAITSFAPYAASGLVLGVSAAFLLKAGSDWRSDLAVWSEERQRRWSGFVRAMDAHPRFTLVHGRRRAGISARPGRAFNLEFHGQGLLGAAFVLWVSYAGPDYQPPPPPPPPPPPDDPPPPLPEEEPGGVEEDDMAPLNPPPRESASPAGPRVSNPRP